MKIGDRVFVRGHIDEIRKDTVIIRNAGGYFGTIPSEVTGELPSAQQEPIKINIEDFNKEDWERLKKEWGNTPITVLPSAQPEPHWIPMSERPPKVREWVLCQCRAGIMDVLRLTEDGYWNKSYPHAEYMSGFVIAWMPLPEPYRAERRADEKKDI